MINISCITVDDFHPAPIAVAAMARSLDYKEVEWNGHKYKGIGLGYSPEGIYGYIGQIFGTPVKPKLEYFRIGTKSDSATTYIHADSICAKYAAVWYLSEAPEGIVAGTAFWKHKAHNIDRLLSREQVVASVGEGGIGEYEKALNADGNDESKWQMAGLCGQKFNRISIYPTDLFHSRYPKDAWGETVADGRIVWTCFFDV